jgi:hypothetical protein
MYSVSASNKSPSMYRILGFEGKEGKEGKGKDGRIGKERLGKD